MRGVWKKLRGICERLVVPRFARKKDGTHQAIVQAFRDASWQVLETYRAPDCPDFFAAHDGRTVAVEVKSKGGKLTASQEKFRQTWTGEYYVVSTLDEAQQILGAK
jgi:hypothetical protein